MVKYGVLKGFYDVERTIGCGGFAKVKLATHLATGEKVAIKIMEKSVLKDDLPRVKTELKALKTLSHQHICKLYQVIETETHFFIVMEYCSGGELFDHIVEKNRLSETESRAFFRQILSAVAYLHSNGYAHRDLKPENVLLDSDQNLKLIDFGLCAQPAGGVQNPLYTSCGSPTYAAPELVLGKRYLGSEVDIWAMGVLLYALLAGYLPFEDQNIDFLYRKILSGKYEQPSHISSGARKLISQMLQVDASNRITIDQLLIHPWIATPTLGPVLVTPLATHNNKLSQVPLPGSTGDTEVVSLLAQYHGVLGEDMWRHLCRGRYDYDTATYWLLVARRARHLPLRLMAGAATRLPVRVKSADSISTPTGIKRITRQSHNTLQPTTTTPSKAIPISTNHPSKTPTALAKATPLSTKHTNIPSAIVTPRVRVQVTALERERVDATVSEIGVDGGNSQLLSPATAAPFAEPRKPSSIRKPQKRIRSPNLEGDCSPVPNKKTTHGNNILHTPEPNKNSLNPNEHSGSARKVFESIERSLHRVKHVLTPRKAVDVQSQPIMLNNKDLCNVSTTECTDPEFVIEELAKGLQTRGILCNRKGFTLRGKFDPNPGHRFSGSCSFELDICYLPPLLFLNSTPMKPSSSTTSPGKSNTTPNTPISSVVQSPAIASRLRSSIPVPKQPSSSLTSSSPAAAAVVVVAARRRLLQSSDLSAGVDCVEEGPSSGLRVGIRRRRLKGDSWCYKKVCEQVLALTATQLSQPPPLESDV